MKKKLLWILSLVLMFSVSAFAIAFAQAEEGTAVYSATEVKAADSSIGYYNPKGEKYGSFPGNSNVIGKIEFEFEGTGIGVMAIGSPGHANAEVFVDDVSVGHADFGSKTGKNEFLNKLGLASGKHIVRVEIPKDAWVEFAGFNVYATSQSYNKVERIDNGTADYRYIGDTGLAADPWGQNENGTALNGKVSAIGAANNSVEYTFTGVGVGVVARDHDPAWGTSIDVYVDGVKKGDAISLKGNTGIKEVFRDTSLTNGEHTVKVTNLENGWLEFDGLNLYRLDDPVATATRVDDAETVKEPDTWFEVKSDSYEGGKAIYNTGSLDMSASYEFSGIGVGVFLEGISQNNGGEFEGGLCRILVDDATAAIVDTREYKGLREVFVTKSLADGKHTVKIVKMDKGNVTFDGFNVYTAGNVKPPVKSVVDDDNGSLIFSTKNGVTPRWNELADAKYSGGKAIFVGGDNVSIAVEYAFSGVGIGFTAEGKSGAPAGDEGAVVEVLIDNVHKADVNLNDFAGIKEVFKTDLEDGMHHVKLVIKEGGWFIFDNFNVYETEKEAPPADKWEGTDALIVNDSDTNIEYSEQWVGQDNKKGYIGNDYHFCGNNKESIITYTFTGVGVQARFERQSAGGTIKVFIDDTLAEEIDLSQTPHEKSAVVFSSDRLVKGTHTIRIERVLNGDQKYIVFDAFEVMKPKGEINLDDTDYRLPENFELDAGTARTERGYHADRVEVSGFADSGRSFVSNVVDSKLTYQFRGAGIEIFVNKRMDGGKFRIFIDGIDYGKVNTYADAYGEQKAVVFQIKGLETKVHTVELVVLKETGKLSEGNYVEFAGMNLLAVDGVDPDNVNPDYDDYVLEGDGSFDETKMEEHLLDGKALHDISAGFGYQADKDKIYTSAVGSSVTLITRGTGFEVRADKNSSGGKFSVTIDGVYKGKVNTYSADGLDDQVVFRAFGLDNDEHTVVLTMIDEKSPAAPAACYVTFTGMRVIKVIGDVDNTTKINNDHYNVSSDGFGIDRQSGYYQGDCLFGNFFGSYVEFKFKGTGIKWFGSMNTDNGVATIYLDGEFYTTVDTRSENYVLSTQLMKITGLENENHTLRIVVEAEYNANQIKSYITVDYFVVYDYAELEFEGYPEVPDDEVVNPGTHPELPDRQPSSGDVLGQAGLPVWAIVLIGVGVFVVLAGAAGAITFAVTKKKQEDGGSEQ